MSFFYDYLQLPSESLLWRSVLQTILIEHAPHLPKQDQQVGRIAAKAKTFPQYAQKAFKKLNLELKVRIRIVFLSSFRNWGKNSVK